jgi:hypothetical protein
MNLENVAILAQIIAAVVVVVGLFVGIGQLRQLQSQRRDTAAVELIRSIQDAEINRALRLIFSLPAGISAADLHARGQEVEDAALLVAIRFEMLGLLVYREAIPYDLMEDMGAAMTVTLWDRLKSWTNETPEAQNHPMWLEWFQWLAEQFARRRRAAQSPAFERHLDWVPSRPS